MGNLLSRRRFVKTALVGAVASSFARCGQAAGESLVLPSVGQHTGELTKLTLGEASELIRSRKVSPVELTQACLSRIERLNPKLNAFITVTADSALAQAHEAESEIKRDRWRGALHGIPIAIKDIVDTAGVRTTAASALFKDRIPTADAHIVSRLKSAGAVLMGKTNLHEFAYGGSSAISHFGAVRNPWNVAYSPGGSSGGSAAAIAARLCYGAIGSDTGGSIRMPAGYCGIVGLKPTYGRVSTTGVIPLSWSLDHVGPMTSTAADAALMLQVIAGYDAEDPASTDMPVPDYLANIGAPTSSLRLGIPRAYFYESLHPDIQAAMDDALSVLKKLTGTQREVAPLATDGTYSSVNAAYGTILTAEAYAYHKDYISKSPELYETATLNRIRVGANVSTAEYIEARRQLDEIRHSVARIFDSVDLLIVPTSPIPPFAIADLTDVNTARAKELQMLHNTRPINALGLPTISISCGLTKQGLPIGMQIIGPPYGEATVLRLARAYEQATDWHNRRPNLD